LIRLRNSIPCAAVLTTLLFLLSCSGRTEPQTEAPAVPAPGRIYLYGEMHGVGKILDREFVLWQNYYEKEGMRHLFVELPFYTAEFLNLWMHAPDDEILDSLWEDTRGTAGNTADAKEFYKRIKEHCPETIFHGTDVGHQYDSTGERFLTGLCDSGQEDTLLYRRTVEAIEQGREYYHPVKDPVYRENAMVQNFIGEYDRLGGENVMGIYGSAHTNLDSLNHTGEVPCMATQLNKRYSPRILSEDLSELVRMIDPVGTDYFLINGKTDGSAEVFFYRSDGKMWNSRKNTVGINPE